MTETKLAEAHKDLVSKRGAHKVLSPIKTGERVWVQNQATLKWDRSGTVIEAMAYRQYTIRLDGSGRLSKRNRKHLKIMNEQSPIDADTTEDGPNIAAPRATPQISRPMRNRRKPERLTYTGK